MFFTDGSGIEVASRVWVPLEFRTALRDEFGVAFFAALAPPLNGVVPLYADDPRQTPFINSEQQYEWRWVIEVCLQVDQTVTVPQTYSDSATVDVVDVSAAYPA